MISKNRSLPGLRISINRKMRHCIELIMIRPVSVYVERHHQVCVFDESFHISGLTRALLGLWIFHRLLGPPPPPQQAVENPEAQQGAGCV